MIQEKEQLAFCMNVSVTETWHNRLCYCYLRVILLLKEEKRTTRQPTYVYHLLCVQAFQFGMQNRKSSRKETCRTSQRLQLISIDVEASQRTPPLNGSLYDVILIDN